MFTWLRTGLAACKRQRAQPQAKKTAALGGLNGCGRVALSWPDWRGRRLDGDTLYDVASDLTAAAVVEAGRAGVGMAGEVLHVGGAHALF